RPSRGSRTRDEPGGWSKSSGRHRPRLDWPSLLGIMNDALRAEVAELADAHDSGSCARKGVGVRVPPSAPATQLTLPRARQRLVCNAAGCGTRSARVRAGRRAVHGLRALGRLPIFESPGTGDYSM